MRTWLLVAGLLTSPLSLAELKVGIVAPLSGAAAPLGTGMQQGIEAYFAKVNAEGGVNGQSLVLQAFDDQYSPLPAAAHTRQLVGDSSLLAAIGNVGTPTAAVTIPIHNQHN
ncbi:ABC transporter substrate-binding protein, partial [Guyparkeria sp. 1SP6A2]|nr:ABC transporter substrate-binding protein [Guyparkeria sp. 1SP6A2]